MQGSSSPQSVRVAVPLKLKFIICGSSALDLNHVVHKLTDTTGTVVEYIRIETPATIRFTDEELYGLNRIIQRQQKSVPSINTEETATITSIASLFRQWINKLLSRCKEVVTTIISEKKPRHSRYRKEITEKLPQVEEENAVVVVSAEESLVINELKNKVAGFIRHTDIIFLSTELESNLSVEATYRLLLLTDRSKVIRIVFAELPYKIYNREHLKLINNLLQKLRSRADMVIALPNRERVIEPATIFLLIVKFIELIGTPGLVNRDLADIITIVKGGNIGIIGFGSTEAADSLSSAVHDALRTEKFIADIGAVSKLLINITGSSKLTVADALSAVKLLQERISKKDVRILWGVRTVENFSEHQVEVIIFAGFTSNHILLQLLTEGESGQHS